MATPTLLRSRVTGLTRLAEGDLHALWQQVTTAAQAQVALNDVLPALIETYGAAAATVAAEWYDEARAKAGVAGRFGAIPARLPDPGVPGLIGWASREATSMDTLLALIAGGVQKRIANASRLTVTGSSLADPRADGWQRTGVGECDFCAMLIGRGAVYSESTVDFGAHDNCHCGAAPAFKGEPRPVRPYVPSVRHSEADQARARRWIADHL